MLWDDKPYYSLNYYIKHTYGEKLYKISLNGGCTCPNRDGNLGKRGCIFCSAGGSGDFAAPPAMTISEQLTFGKELVGKKFQGHSYIAYFQAYTNTYAPVEKLRKIFTEAIMDPEVKVLSIATRPDCLGDDILELLDELNHIKPVWVELGLQTVHSSSAKWMRRGYELPVFEKAVRDLHRLGIEIITHVILYLPSETTDDMLQTIHYLNALPISGIKLQLLHILEHTDLATYYKEVGFHVPDMEEYFHLLGLCICDLRPDIVIHRLTGDGPKSELIAPLWTGNKRYVMNSLSKYFKEHQIWQGKTYIAN